MTADASIVATSVVPANTKGRPQEHESPSGPAGASTLARLLAAGSIDFSHVSGPRDDTVRDFLAFAVQVTALAGQLHRQGTIHGAITPAVIALNAEGEVVAIYPSEQGAPSAAEVPDTSEPEALPYGLAYSSPELTGRMNRLVDHRTDPYSLGVVFYRLLAGQLPFEAPDPLSLVHDHLATKPTPPAQSRPDLPLPVSDIVVKLLAKDPRDRYQSADGLARDWEICLASWQSTGRIEPFPLGQTDVSDRLLLPQTLYGRESDLDRLLRAFDDACSGVAQLVLISGDSGIGKTSLVGELAGPVAARGGMLISGRTEEGQRQSMPYGTIMGALEDFVNQVLAGYPVQIAAWKNKLTLALSGNTAQLSKSIPDLAQIIEAPADVSPEASDPKVLLTLALQSFLRAIAEPEHPLVLFLDDVQRADAGSLKLVRDLTIDSDLCLLAICAYREDQGADSRIPEVLASIPTERHLALAPLDPVDTCHFLADALHSTPERVGKLASLIHDKTGGNAFFVREFLRTLYDQKLIFFDPKNRAWQWDLARIKATPITDNIVELVRSRLKHLPEQAQKTLKVAAIMGSQVETSQLAAACQQTPAETERDLQLALDLGAMEPIAASLRQPSLIKRPTEPRPAAMEQMAARYLSGRVEERIVEAQFQAEETNHKGVAAVRANSAAAMRSRMNRSGRLPGSWCHRSPRKRSTGRSAGGCCKT